MDTIDQVILNFSEANLLYLNISLGIIMFGVAINLRVDDFVRVVRNPRAALAGALSQFLLLPALTFLLILVLQPRPSFALGMMLVAACPGGNISNFMSAMARGNAALSVSLTAISSALSIIMTPLNLALWARLYSPTAQILKSVHLDFWKLFETIALLLIIPITLGMLVRRFQPNLAERLHPILHRTSILIFAIIVFMAFQANFDYFLEYIHYVIFLVLLHNAAALSLGYQVGRIFKLPLEDKRTLSIETGIQNSGLGLILIFSFFDGLGGMAIIAAWWGIWHIFSGLALAYLWNKSSRFLSQEISQPKG